MQIYLYSTQCYFERNNIRFMLSSETLVGAECYYVIPPVITFGELLGTYKNNYDLKNSMLF